MCIYFSIVFLKLNDDVIKWLVWGWVYYVEFELSRINYFVNSHFSFIFKETQDLWIIQSVICRFKVWMTSCLSPKFNLNNLIFYYNLLFFVVIFNKIQSYWCWYVYNIQKVNYRQSYGIGCSYRKLEPTRKVHA